MSHPEFLHRLSRVRRWTFFVVLLIGLGIQVYRYAGNTSGNWPHILIELLVISCVGTIALLPLTLIGMRIGHMRRARAAAIQAQEASTVPKN